MTIEQIKSEMNSLMEKVSKLETIKSEVTLTKEQLTALVETVIEDTTRQIRDGLIQDMPIVDDYVEINLNDREIVVDTDMTNLTRELLELVDEKGLGVTFNEDEMTDYVDELITRIKKLNLVD